MGFNLAGFAEGIHPAIQDLAQKARAGREADILLKGLIYGEGGDQSGAMGRNTGLAAGTAPPPATATPAAPLSGPPPTAPAFAGPGGPPPMAGPPAPSPMPGATPMPGMGQQPPQQGAPPPGAGPITAGAGGALGPAPQVQPNGPPQAPQGPGAQPQMSGVAQPSGNEFQDSQKTLKSIVMNLRQANPKARPAEILAAADRQIQSMKGLSSETSALLRFQASNLAIDQRRDAALQRAETAQQAMQISVDNLKAKLEAAERIQQDRDQTRRDTTRDMIEGRHQDTQTNADSRRDVAGTNAGARMGAARVGAGARVQSATIGADSRRDVAKTNQGGATTREGMRGQTARDVANTNAGAREYSAEAGANAKLFKAPPPRPGSAPAAAVKVKSAAEAQKLKPGTTYETPDGRHFIR